MKEEVSQYIASLPPYAGVSRSEVQIVDAECDAEAVLAALMSANAVGFDTESTTFARDRGTTRGPHLIQLATDERVYLFRVDRCPHLHIARQVLSSREILKVGFGLKEDRKLLKSKLGVDVRQAKDLANSLRDLKNNPMGIKRAVAFVFEQQLHKARKVTFSNWSTRKLSDRQILYAANDAMVALRIYRQFPIDRKQGSKQYQILRLLTPRDEVKPAEIATAA